MVDNRWEFTSGAGHKNNFDRHEPLKSSNPNKVVDKNKVKYIDAGRGGKNQNESTYLDKQAGVNNYNQRK